MIPKMAVGDICQAALKGENFRCMGGVRRRFVKAKTGAFSSGVLEAGLEDMGMQARRIVLVGLEWSGTPGGRLVSGGGRVTLVGATPFKYIFVGVIPLSLRLFRNSDGSRCVKSFHECMTC